MVWKPNGIQLKTQIKVYRATVLTTLLYGAETWTCYGRHENASFLPYTASQISYGNQMAGKGHIIQYLACRPVSKRVLGEFLTSM